MARHGSSKRPEAFAWLASNRQLLLQRLSETGAVLFRGFPFITDEDFDQAIRIFELKNFPFEESMSNAERRQRTERVFTAKATATYSPLSPPEQPDSPPNPPTPAITARA